MCIKCIIWWQGSRLLCCGSGVTAAVGGAGRALQLSCRHHHCWRCIIYTWPPAAGPAAAAVSIASCNCFVTSTAAAVHAPAGSPALLLLLLQQHHGPARRPAHLISFSLSSSFCMAAATAALISSGDTCGWQHSIMIRDDHQGAAQHHDQR